MYAPAVLQELQPGVPGAQSLGRDARADDGGEQQGGPEQLGQDLAGEHQQQGRLRLAGSGASATM
jgi:hypothetical protein